MTGTVTGHLIDPGTLERRGYALACKRVTGRHTFGKIAERIHSVHKEYGLVGEVQNTVTDNAANFGKAFRKFSQETEESSTAEEGAEAANTDEGLENENSDEDETGDDGKQKDDEDQDDEGEVVIENTKIARSVDDDDDGVVTLPPQINCCSHTLNLIATKDIAHPTKVEKISTEKRRIPDILKYKERKDVFDQKLSKLWRRLSKSTLACDLSQEICGTAFSVPIYTRWNSERRIVKKILKAKPKDINTLVEKLKLPKLKAVDFEFLIEWDKIMDPLGIAIDMLQGEENCFMGIIKPTIRSA